MIILGDRSVLFVEQALMFSATMRLDDSVVDKNRREQFVDSILSVSVFSRRLHRQLPLWLPSRVWFFRLRDNGMSMVRTSTREHKKKALLLAKQSGSEGCGCCRVGGAQETLRLSSWTHFR